ncbi:MAG TPA: hypothetical protein VKB38_00375 [Terracidiphilus sp.]|nr:hypothetical protein [Terracidiphilus sp.]
MNVASILRLEMWGFLVLLGAVVFYRLITRQINLKGLLIRKSGARGVSPERIQLLLATIAMSANYLHGVLTSTTGNLPDVDAKWLYVFGGSSAIYAGGKALTELKTLKGDLERQA